MSRCRSGMQPATGHYSDCEESFDCIVTQGRTLEPLCAVERCAVWSVLTGALLGHCTLDLVLELLRTGPEITRVCIQYP